MLVDAKVSNARLSDELNDVRYVFHGCPQLALIAYVNL